MPPPRQDVQLPQEIWQKVASHMSIIEWAGVSGTSRSMFHLQLENVRFKGNIHPKGIEWLSKRWSEAHTMSITRNELPTAILPCPGLQPALAVPFLRADRVGG
ncbi:hypothetical protein WJX75_007870 [Coccomyxa subellipsoidea]|uniref:F-box domain-containing protein n=1 Tax=Coccomyxa subellipsoidea TaxID=248742 RepID=A0ABR2Z3X1_9CHLO